MQKLRMKFALLTSIFLFTSCVAHAQSNPQVQSGLSVVDAKGKRVGAVLGFASTEIQETIGSAPVIALKMNGFLLVLAVESDRFVGSRSFLVFESTDCSGTPFLEASTPDIRLVPRSAVMDQIVYAEATNNVQTVTIHSRMPVNGSILPSTCQTNINPSNVRVTQAVPVTDMSVHFTPPFSIR